MNNPILTIIVPVYNMSKYLNRCLSSFLLTDKNDLQVILVNDGSTDNSLEIIQNFVKQNKLTNIEVIDKDNEGYGPTIKRGILKSKGIYLKILDSDDFFYPEKLQEHIDFLKKNIADIIITKFIKIYKNKTDEWKIDNNLLNSNSNNVIVKKKNTKELCNLINMHNITVNANYIKKQLNSFDFPKKISFTDTIYSVICYTNARTIKYNDIVLYNYSLNIDGQTMQNTLDIDKFFNMVNSYNEIISILQKLYHSSQNAWKEAIHAYISLQFDIYISRIFWFMWKYKYNKCGLEQIKKKVQIFDEYKLNEYRKIQFDWINSIFSINATNFLYKKILLYKAIKKNKKNIIDIILWATK